MTTAATLINGALRLLKVASSDVTISGDEAADALEALNQMISSWSVEGLQTYHVTTETIALTPALNPHTIGTGGALNTARPIEILAASIHIPNGIDIPLTQLDYDGYNAIRLKTVTNDYPAAFYYEPAYPLGNIFLYPVPSGSSIILNSRKELSGWSTLTTNVELPPGYDRAIKYNLAVELAPEYQRDVDQLIDKTAIRTLKIIKRRNLRLTWLSTDASLISSQQMRPNIYRGW